MNVTWSVSSTTEDRCRALNVAAAELTSRHHQLVSKLAKANEDVQRASVVVVETQLAANKASHARVHRYSLLYDGMFHGGIARHPTPTANRTDPRSFDRK